jgi:hypothetical protein
MSRTVTGVLIAAVILIFLAVAGIPSFSPAGGQAIEDLLRSLLSSPVLIAIIILFWGGAKFRDSLAHFVDRIHTVKGPGFEASTLPQQSRESPNQEEAEKRNLDLTPEQRQEIQDQVQQLAGLLAREEQQRTEIVQLAGSLLEQKQTEATFWRFEYLSLFLVFRTQLVLQWFAGPSAPATQETYEAFWRLHIQEEGQLQLILDVGRVPGAVGFEPAAPIWLSGLGYLVQQRWRR